MTLDPNTIAAISDAYAISTPPDSIYTVNDDNSTVDCLLVENGIILATGNLGMLGVPCRVTLVNR